MADSAISRSSAGGSSTRIDSFPSSAISKSCGAMLVHIPEVMHRLRSTPSFTGKPPNTDQPCHRFNKQFKRCSWRGQVVVQGAGQPAYWNTLPPLTKKFCPVMKSEPGPARKMTIGTMSAGTCVRLKQRRPERNASRSGWAAAYVESWGV